MKRKLGDVFERCENAKNIKKDEQLQNEVNDIDEFSNAIQYLASQMKMTQSQIMQNHDACKVCFYEAKCHNQHCDKHNENCIRTQVYKMCQDAESIGDQEKSTKTLNAFSTFAYETMLLHDLHEHSEIHKFDASAYE